MLIGAMHFRKYWDKIPWAPGGVLKGLILLQLHNISRPQYLKLGIFSPKLGEKNVIFHLE